MGVRIIFLCTLDARFGPVDLKTASHCIANSLLGVSGTVHSMAKAMKTVSKAKESLEPISGVNVMCRTVADFGENRTHSC